MSALDQLNGASGAINSGNWLKLENTDVCELQVCEIGAPYLKEWQEGKPSQHMRLDCHVYNVTKIGAEPTVLDEARGFDPQCGWLVELKDLANVLTAETGDPDAILKQRLFVRRKDRKGSKGFFYGWLEISTLGDADQFGSPEAHVDALGKPLFAGVTLRRAPQNDGAPGTAAQAPSKPATPPARPGMAAAPAAAPRPAAPAPAPAARPAAVPPPARPGPAPAPGARPAPPAPPAPPFVLAKALAELNAKADDPAALIVTWNALKGRAGAQKPELADAYKTLAYYAGQAAIGQVSDSATAQEAWALAIRLMADFPQELGDWLKPIFTDRCIELGLTDDIPF